ncbi:MAG TPA: alcohol dehydrogenase catalytic domain-containing protein [Sphingobium sp.]|uniref:alcohol dehydrogenase catalytic domain-containing protein n=1 Tax=Sphingobium sp. TaxID=1912891 RepID=UPI002ED2C470
MKAAVYAGKGGPISIETLPDPEPGPDDVLIKVHRCGICGTDLSMTKGAMWDYGPGQFGHEYAGEIVALGRNVEGFRIGERISVLPSLSCGTCEAAHGNHVLCRHAGGATFGFSELASVPASVAVRLPSVLSMADGAVIEPMAISLYGVRQARITPGDRVLVLGGGTVALYAIYWAKRLGAGRIVAMSRSERRRDLALQMGADAFIRYGDGEVGEVAEALGGAPELVFECVGSEGMLGKALNHLALFGKIVSLGFCTRPDPIMPAIASYKCASMQFVVGYGMRDFLYVADQMDKGHVDPKAIITNDIPLHDMPAMFERLRGPNDETKVHVLL